MTGQLLITNTETEEEKITELSFRAGDVGHFYVIDEGIKLFLYNQGYFVLEPDEKLLEELNTIINA